MFYLKTASDAEKIAVHYINDKYKPQENWGCFNFYFVVVGEDPTQTKNPIYAQGLQEHELLLNSEKDAKKTFLTKCDPKNQFLVKVEIYDGTLKPKVLFDCTE